MFRTWIVFGSYLYRIWIVFGSYLNRIWIVFESYLNITWVVFDSWLQTWAWPRHSNRNRIVCYSYLKRSWVLYKCSWLGNRIWIVVIVFETYLVLSLTVIAYFGLVWAWHSYLDSSSRVACRTVFRP